MPPYLLQFPEMFKDDAFISQERAPDLVVVLGLVFYALGLNLYCTALVLSNQTSETPSHGCMILPSDLRYFLPPWTVSLLEHVFVGETYSIQEMK